MKYPLAGKLQQGLTSHLTANPYEVHSSSGLEQTFGHEDDANAYADEIRGAGATRVAVKKRAVKLRPPRPLGAPPMHHAPRGLPPGVPNPRRNPQTPKCDHAALKADPTAWKACRLVGHQHTPADETGPVETIELRDCPHCKSTLAIVVDAPKENPAMKKWKEGARVRFAPTAASFALYTRPPPAGAAGSVVSVPLGGRRSTYLPGPGGGLVYVDWDGFGVMGASPSDLARGNPEETHDTDILAGMEGAIWLTSYASWVEEQSDAKRKRLGPGPGGNWEDVVPLAPASALLAAQDVYTLIERANHKTPGQLLDLAAAADGARATPEYAELFGHYLAMETMGHGVSWFDDHAVFPLKFGRGFEAYSFDGKSVDWSPRVTKGNR